MSPPSPSFPKPVRPLSLPSPTQMDGNINNNDEDAAAAAAAVFGLDGLVIPPKEAAVIETSN